MDIEKEVFEDAEDALPKEFEHMTADAINNRARLLENEIRVLKDEATRLTLDQNSYKEKVKEKPGGCGCRLEASGSRSPQGLGLALLVGAAVVARRRQRANRVDAR